MQVSSMNYSKNINYEPQISKSDSNSANGFDDILDNTIDSKDDIAKETPVQDTRREVNNNKEIDKKEDIKSEKDIKDKSNIKDVDKVDKKANGVKEVNNEDKEECNKSLDDSKEEEALNNVMNEIISMFQKGELKFDEVFTVNEDMTVEFNTEKIGYIAKLIDENVNLEGLADIKNLETLGEDDLYLNQLVLEEVSNLEGAIDTEIPVEEIISNMPKDDEYKLTKEDAIELAMNFVSGEINEKGEEARKLLELNDLEVPLEIISDGVKSNFEELVNDMKVENIEADNTSVDESSNANLETENIINDNMMLNMEASNENSGDTSSDETQLVLEDVEDIEDTTNVENSGTNSNSFVETMNQNSSHISNQINNENLVNENILNNEVVSVKENYVSKFVETVNVSKQMIEGMKLTMSEGSTEMHIVLDPEKLGKIDLKVTTDRGIMVAQFEAENQRVKEIIESNMQMLKRNLEDQGIVVQNLSVSVNDNSSKNGSFSGNNEQSGKNPHKIAQNSINKMVSVAENNINNNIRARRTKMVPSSKVDFIA